METIKAAILASIKKFISNMSDMQLEDIIGDALTEVADYINYQDGDEFPQPCIVLAKDLVKIRINKMGAEGLESQNYGTHSEGYIDGLPDDIKRKLARYRKLPRA